MQLRLVIHLLFFVQIAFLCYQKLSKNKINNQNYPISIYKGHNNQYSFVRLTKNASVTIQNQQECMKYRNPQYLVDDYLYLNQVMTTNTIFQLHELESLLFKFKEPIIFNWLQLRLKLEQFEIDDYCKSKMDETQIRRIRVFALYRRKELLLINTLICNNEDVKLISSENRQYLKVFIPCIEKYCGNYYLSYRIQLVSLSTYISVYPIHFLQMQNIMMML